MKLKGTLPVPSLSAMLLEPIGKQPREVVILGTPAAERRVRQAGLRRGGVHHCSICSSTEHNVRRCPDAPLAETKAILRARRA